jgi:hypothetical protein
MKSILFALVLLVASTAHANEGDWWLDIHVLSYHNNDSRTWYDDDGKAREWQEDNWGLGVGYGITQHMELKAGAYRNSHDATSVYAGVKWHTDYERLISIGLLAGLVTGYEETQHVDGPVTGYLLPVIGIHPHYRVRAEIGYIPGSIGAGQQVVNQYGEIKTSENTDLITVTIGILF